jgi:EmrB/QacA subfamily drug resistance transporter
MDATTIHRNRWVILALLGLSLLVIGLDSLIITLALPSIQTDLKAGVGQLQWTVDAYTLLFGSLVMFAGGLADRFGRKLILMVGLGLFLIASLGAATAGDIDTLIAWRACMGTGGAMIMPSTLAIIKQVFPPEEQRRAVFIWSAIGALGTPLGPIVGGIMLDHFWWGSVFWINIPTIGVILAAGAVLIPESRHEGHPGLDVPGAALSVAGFGLLTYGLIEAPSRGWLSPLTLFTLALSLVLLAGFASWERQATHPMLRIELFRDPRFGLPAIVILFQWFTMGGTMFVITQYLQYARGHSPLQAGLRMLAILGMMLAAPLMKFSGRLGLRLNLAAGLLVTAAAELVIATSAVQTEPQVLIGLGLLGVGLGLNMPTAANSILAATPEHQSGAGSAVIDSAARVGGALGVALIGSVLTTTYRKFLQLPPGVPAIARNTAHDSIGGAQAVAHHLGNAGTQLLVAADRAFGHAMTSATVVGFCAAITAAGCVLLIRPRRSKAAGAVATADVTATELDTLSDR